MSPIQLQARQPTTRPLVNYDDEQRENLARWSFPERSQPLRNEQNYSTHKTPALPPGD
jgi:hypothetical protein